MSDRKPGSKMHVRGGLLALAVLAAAASASAGGKGDAPPASTFPDAQAFVNAHNAVRAGVQKPVGYAGAWTPIPPVAWSDEVAITSQQWAEHLRDQMKCKLAHSDTRYGENLAGGKDLNIARAVNMWASEGRQYSYAPQYAFEIPTGHYTQVVWRRTTHIGCGRASCGKKSVVVCRYSPPGNHIGKAPF